MTKGVKLKHVILLYVSKFYKYILDKFKRIKRTLI